MANVNDIYTRRSTREFTDKKIDPKKIEKIIEAGLRAPSSKNTQPWYMIVLNGKKKDKICDFVTKEDFCINTIPKSLKEKLKNQRVLDTVKASVKIARSADFLILIFNRSPLGVNRKKIYKKTDFESHYHHEMDIVGIGACMQNMLLASHFLGLGAVVLADIYTAEKEIKEFLRIDYDFIVSIALGYPKKKMGKRSISNENVRYLIEKQ